MIAYPHDNKYASKIIYHSVYKYSQLRKGFIDSYKKETEKYTKIFRFFSPCPCSNVGEFCQEARV